MEVLLRSLSFHANDIGICKNHVQVRNNCSHASGRIYYKTQSRIENYIIEELEFVEKIQGKLKGELKKVLQTFLEENWHEIFIPEGLKKLFEENYFSIKDLEFISTVDLPLFRKKSHNEENIKQKIFYLLLLFEIQNKIEDEKNLFLEKLPIFMINLPEIVKIKKDDDINEIYTSELIEEYLIPIISKFSDKDRIEAEEILKLRG